MASSSLNHKSSLNHSFYETLHHNLSQAYALAHVALMGNLMSCEPSILHDYLSIMEDLILKARVTLEGVFNELDGA